MISTSIDLMELPLNSWRIQVGIPTSRTMRIIRKELAYIRALLFSGAKAYPDLCMYIYIYICHGQNWWPLSDLAYLAHHSYCILNLQAARFDPSKLRQWLATFQHHTFVTERRGLGMLSDLSLKLSLSHLSVCNHIPFLHLRISQVFLLFGCVSRFLC